MIFSQICDDFKEIEIFKHPFFVENSESLQLTIIDGCFEHVPIIIRDPLGVVRAVFTLKSRIKTHYIGGLFSHTSNGAVPGELITGMWTLEIFKPSFRVTGLIQIEIRLDRQLTNITTDKYFDVLNQDFIEESVKHHKWMKAELHSHSYFSDGRVSFEEIQTELQHKELDIVAIMDHSIVTTQFLKGASKIIPGTEITLDNEVHYNAYGLKELIGYTDFFSEEKEKNESLNKMFEFLNKKGNLLSINHPFSENMGLQHDFNLAHFQFIEVVNSPHSASNETDNEKAIRFFDFLWSNGHYLFGIGGSDAHKKNDSGRYPAGNPTNRIYCESFSLEQVLHSMAKGNLYIESEFPCELKIKNSTGKQVLPGSECIGEVRFQAKGERSVRWQLIENGRVIMVHDGESCDFETTIKQNSYIRIEAIKNGQHVLFVNPIVNQLTNETSITSFAKIIQQFEIQEKLL